MQFLFLISNFCKVNIICIYFCTWILTNPKTSTQLGTYSFSHLQHASKCSRYKIRNLALHILVGTQAVQKKCFDGPPGILILVKIFLGYYMCIYIYVYTYIVNIFRALLKVNHVACLITPASPTFFGVLRTFSVVLARYTSHASTSPNSMWTAWHWRYCSPSTLKLKGTTRSLGILFSISLGLIGT